MLRRAALHEPKCRANGSGDQGLPGKPYKYYPAPTDSGQTPCNTALTPDPCFTDELFDKYPPPEDWSKEDLRLMKAQARGQKMQLPSPSLEQLQAWNLESYEQFCILTVYELP